MTTEVFIEGSHARIVALADHKGAPKSPSNYCKAIITDPKGSSVTVDMEEEKEGAFFYFYPTEGQLPGWYSYKVIMSDGTPDVKTIASGGFSVSNEGQK